MNEYLNMFNRISLSDIQKVQLMKRVDSKFIITKDQLYGYLPLLTNFYDVMHINNEMYMPYETFYYDTPDFEMYKMHHNGKKNRYKIRFRKYKNSDDCFLEIKFKNNKSQTVKNRINSENTSLMSNEKEIKFIKKNSTYNPENLEFKIFNSFNRITLAHKTKMERITIDNDLSFFSEKGNFFEINNLSIIEIKQEKFNLNSEFMQLLKNNHIRNTSISKYCSAATVLNPELKNNRFKQKIYLINRMNNEI